MLKVFLPLPPEQTGGSEKRPPLATGAEMQCPANLKTTSFTVTNSLIYNLQGIQWISSDGKKLGGWTFGMQCKSFTSWKNVIHLVGTLGIHQACLT